MRTPLLLAVTCLTLLTGSAAAQPAADPPGLDALIARVEQRAESAPSDAERQALEATLGILRSAASTATETAALRAAAEGVDSRLDEIQSELRTPLADDPVRPPAGATLAELEQLQAQASADLSTARAKLEELQAELSRRQDRRSAIPGELAAARQQLADLRSAPAPAPESGSDPTPEQLRSAAELRAAEARVELLEAEQQSYDARRELLPARIDLAARRAEQAEQRLRTWRSVVGSSRQLEAERAAQSAVQLGRETARRVPSLSAFAEETEAMATARTLPGGTPAQTSAAERKAAAVRSELDELRKRYRAGQRRLEASGLNRATGLLLRSHFDQLADIGVLRRDAAATHRAIAEAELALIEYQEERLAYGDVEAVATRLLRQAGVDPADQAAREAAVDIASARRELLDRLIADETQRLDILLELDRYQRELLEGTAAYHDFIRERILWVPSVPRGGTPTPDAIAGAARWAVQPEMWRQAADRAAARVRENPVGLVFAVLALSIGFAAARLVRKRLPEIAQQAGKFRTDRLSLTFAAIGVTAVAAVPMPGVLLLAAWLLGPAGQQTMAGRLSMGLGNAAAVLAVLTFVRVGLRQNGLGVVHFRWPLAAVRRVRRHLNWLTPVVTISLVLTAAASGGVPDEVSGTFGRLFFTVSAAAVAIAIMRCLGASGPLAPLLAPKLRMSADGRWWMLFVAVLAAVPLGLAALAWAGYAYTAQEVSDRLKLTLALAVLLLVLNGLLLRWLFLARRQVAVETARRKREQAIADAADDQPEGPTEAAAPPIDETQLDLPAISAQTKQLFGAALLTAAVLGVLAIWADVLPALRVLDRVQLYPGFTLIDVDRTDRLPQLETADETARHGTGTEPATGSANGSANADAQTPAANGTAPTIRPSGIPMVPDASPAAAPDETTGADGHRVTAADAGLTIVILVITFAAFRNLPGLVEIVVLQRLPLDAGSRYALTTVLRYIIAITGIIMAFNAIKLEWNQIQWLAAALTFGLGFGLQEIFANFVSGLIILAERPVRLGDTVTVGGVTGTVSRIKMRATTITDWDRKELVIPNKNFITGDVINWSLSDPILRMTIPVGVGYGEDIDLAEKTLLAVAAEHQSILPDPKPYAVFTRFGDSTLDFELRFYIPSIEVLITVRHDMHMRITKAFREAGIEIAFPQRDLHVRSAEGLEMLLPRAAQTPPAGDQPPP